MKTIQEIQTEVLATMQPTIDKVRLSIQSTWETAWSTYQGCLNTYQLTDWYNNRLNEITKDNEDKRRLYSNIASGQYVDLNKTKEESMAAGLKRLAELEKELIVNIQYITKQAIYRLFCNSYGYTFDLPYDPKHNSKEELKNKSLEESGILNISSNCNGSRSRFEKYLSNEIDATIEVITNKLNQAITKKLESIKNSIQYFTLIESTVEQGNCAGIWKITTNDHSYRFKTESILAGGWNIQCLHVRYITNLKLIH